MPMGARSHPESEAKDGVLATVLHLLSTETVLCARLGSRSVHFHIFEAETLLSRWTAWATASHKRPLKQSSVGGSGCYPAPISGCSRFSSLSWSRRQERLFRKALCPFCSLLRLYTAFNLTAFWIWSREGIEKSAFVLYNNLICTLE